MPVNKDNLFELAKDYAEDGRLGNRTYRDQGHKCQKFVTGDQWDKADAKALTEKGVLPITVNGMLPIRDHLVGRQTENPRDLSVLPAKGGNGVIASIISAMLKHVIGQSNGLSLKTEMFRDGITTGRGFIGLDTDYSTDPVSGDIVLKCYSPFRVDPDPLGMMNYDLNIGGRYINVWEWQDRDLLAVKYPDAEIESGAGKGSYGAVTWQTIKNLISSFVGRNIATDIDGEEAESLDAEVYNQLTRRRLPVLTSWIKTYEKVAYWVDGQNRKIMRLMKPGEISKARSWTKSNPQRFQIYETTLPVLNKVVIVEDMELECVRDPFKFLDGFGFDFNREGKPLIFDTQAVFPIVGFYPYLENGLTFGKMDNIIGPQMERNKRRTQFLRLLNSLAAAGWMWKENSLSEDMKEKLENFGTRPDLSIEYKDQPPQKIQPVETAGAGYLTASMTSERDMEEIASVNRESLAKRGPTQSGVAINLKQQSDATGNEIVFANLSYSSMIFGNLLMPVLRCGGYYSYEEIESLIDSEDLVSGPVLTEAVKRVGPPPVAPPPPNPAAMQLAQTQFGEKGQMLNAAVQIEFQRATARFKKQDEQYKEAVKTEGKNIIMEGIKDIKVGRYGVKVVEAPTSPTVRTQRLDQLLALDERRPGQLPFDELIEATDIPHKERILEKIKNQTGIPAPVLPAGNPGV